MRIEWLNKISSDRVILFYNGWGMDAAAVSHLRSDCDVVMCNDYRSLELEDGLPDLLRGYREVYLVAWSMGVWAAANTISRMGIRLSTAIALNGTEHPVDDQYGIPSKIYLLTERGMTERGREKFMQRMLDGPEEIKQFEQNKSLRSVGEVCEELSFIREQSICSAKNEIKWNKIYISNQDVIFPVKNQQAWWQDKFPVVTLAGGHYPFYHFDTWEEIIGIKSEEKIIDL
ncbi:MAG: DUF452 family protein [Odoribacter sp.]